MSEVNGTTMITVDAHEFGFKQNGKLPERKFWACVGDLKAEMDDLRPKDNETMSAWEYIDKIVQMVAKNYDVTLTRGEADAFANFVEIRYAEKKSEDTAAWRSAARLPPSTASAPAE